jgi:hypothetical protein
VTILKACIIGLILAFLPLLSGAGIFREFEKRDVFYCTTLIHFGSFRPFNEAWDKQLSDKDRLALSFNTYKKVQDGVPPKYDWLVERTHTIQFKREGQEYEYSCDLTGDFETIWSCGDYYEAIVFNESKGSLAIASVRAFSSEYSDVSNNVFVQLYACESF